MADGHVQRHENRSWSGTVQYLCCDQELLRAQKGGTKPHMARKGSVHGAAQLALWSHTALYAKLHIGCT